MSKSTVKVPRSWGGFADGDPDRWDKAVEDMGIALVPINEDTVELSLPKGWTFREEQRQDPAARVVTVFDTDGKRRLKALEITRADGSVSRGKQLFK